MKTLALTCLVALSACTLILGDRPEGGPDEGVPQDLGGADLTGTDLTAADLTGADLAVPDCGKIARVLRDDFSDVAASARRWKIEIAGGSPTAGVLGGVLHFLFSQAGGGRSAVSSFAQADLRESAFSFRLVRHTTSPGVVVSVGLAHAYHAFTDGKDLTASVGFEIEGNQLRGVAVAGADPMNPTTASMVGDMVQTVPYDPAAHRFLRVRHTATRIYWEASADGAAWSLLFENVMDTTFAAAVEVRTSVVYPAQSGSTVDLDDFNFPGADGPRCGADMIDDPARGLRVGGPFFELNTSLDCQWQWMGGMIATPRSNFDVGCDLYTRAFYDLTGRRLVVPVASTITAPGLVLGVMVSADDGRGAVFGYDATTQVVAGGDTTDRSRCMKTLSAPPRAFSFAVAGDTLTLEYSLDGVGFEPCAVLPLGAAAPVLSGLAVHALGVQLSLRVPNVVRGAGERVTWYP